MCKGQFLHIAYGMDELFQGNPVAVHLLGGIQKFVRLVDDDGLAIGNQRLLPPRALQQIRQQVVVVADLEVVPAAPCRLHIPHVPAGRVTFAFLSALVVHANLAFHVGRQATRGGKVGALAGEQRRERGLCARVSKIEEMV